MRAVEFAREIEAMEGTRKFINTVRFILAGTIVMYALVVLVRRDKPA